MRRYSDTDLESLRVNSLERPYQAQMEPIPELWTPDHLSRRLVEAFSILRRLPRVKGPRAPGNHGPAYMHDWADRLAQVEDPEILKEHQDQQNRDRSQPSALEIQRMEQCNDFLRAFRDQDALGAQVLARWALAAAFGQSVAKKAQAMGLAKSSFYARREGGLKACAAMLNRSGIGVF